jgi:hypothetical protein
VPDTFIEICILALLSKFMRGFLRGEGIGKEVFVPSRWILEISHLKLIIF